MSYNRKNFERPATYTTVGYRIHTEAYGGFFVDKYAEMTAEDTGYEIKTRSLALKVLRQFIWDNHKNIGRTYDMADFDIEGKGYYNDGRYME